MQMAATMTTHRGAAVAAILLVATAAATGQTAAPTEAGAQAPSALAGGRGPGATAPTTSAARVPPSLAVITVRCTKFHVVKEGETCASVARDFRLTLTQFEVLNQEVNYTCGAAPLPHGRWVCVRGTFIGA